jgi:hypothetical protein
MQTIVTKGEYAALKGRAPSAISNWIAEGKISADALIGQGVRARIWVERADADLARSLDPAQQAAQDRPVGIGSPVHPALPETPRPASAPPALPASGQAPAYPTPIEADDDLRRRRKADADRAEAEAEQARRKLNVDAGRWIEASAATREFAQQVAKLIADTETFLAGPLARQLADAHSLDWKALSVEIRAAWRKQRESAADEASAALAGRDAELADAA